MPEPAIYGTSLWGEPLEPPPAPNKLSADFLVPPFSVLNAREGWWQDRKRAWISLGIKSEIGRGSGVHEYSAAATIHRQGSTLGFDGSKVLAERNAQANHAAPAGSARPACDYSNRERGSGSVIKGTSANANGNATSGPASNLGRCFGQDLMRGEHVLGMQGNQDDNQSGTSIFDPVLCELAYRWFCPPAGLVLDPFAGGSVRGIVAAMLGRRYWGCDLRPEQVQANREQAAAICPDNLPIWSCGDALDELPAAPLADMLFSCPPYGDLEVYSDDPRDLSTMPHAQFVAAYGQIIALAAKQLKPDRFACFVVGDFRCPKGHYRDFVSETIKAFKLAGLDYYNEAVLVTAVGSLPIRITKQFLAGRKLGKTHQNVLVFVKGDWRRAAKQCEEAA